MNEITKIEPGTVAKVQTTAITPMTMLQMAVEQGADLDKMQKLMDLQERWEANEAKKAYVKSMAAFKSNPPDLRKNKRVSYRNKQGQLVEYDHAKLDDVASDIGAALSQHGLSHSWETKQNDAAISVTCHITHEQGHRESVSLHAGADQTGSKNSIQALGSTVTYLQRYTLLAATGLAAKEQDDDGQAAVDIPRLSIEQQANIEKLIKSSGKNRTAFLGWIGAKSLDRIRADQYDRCVKALEKKRTQPE